jgi:hypothetical protein
MSSQSKCRFSVYATPQEHQFFRDRAKARRMTVSRYVRSLADSEQIATAEQLRNIQQHTRQLTRCLNGLRHVVSDTEHSSQLFSTAIALLIQIEEEAQR